MIEIDEAVLISFFEILPEPESADEREFFSAPLFLKCVGGIKLSFSVSASHRDLRLELAYEARPGRLLQYVLENLVSVSIEVDRDGMSWLRAISESSGRIALSVDPTIELIIQDGNVTA